MRIISQVILKKRIMTTKKIGTEFMKKNLALIIVVSISLFIFFYLISFICNAESGAPPIDGGESFGDWTIRGGEKRVRENQQINLEGNLTIEKNGFLTFRNVTLFMNSSYDGEYSIIIEEFGNFFIYDSDDNSSTYFDSSMITSYDDSFEYNFIIEENSEFIMKNSEIHECGDSETTKGLTIKSEDVLIENCIISDNHYGIYSFSSSSAPKIFNNSIFDNFYGLYVYMGASPEIENNYIYDNENGVFCSWKTDINIINCTIESNENFGVSIKDCDVNLINCDFSNNRIDIQCSRSEPKIINCTMDSIDYDFYLERETSATTLNSTFDESKVFYKSSDLAVQWYLNVRTINQNGRPISGIMVQVMGNDSSFDDFFLSDEEGFVRDIVVTEYSASKGSKILHTPHLITAVKERSGSDPDVQQFFETINSTKTVYVEYVTVNISFVCNDNVKTVKKGDTTTFTFTITNNGDDTENISFQLFGFFVTTANLTKTEIVLTSGESLTLNLLKFTVPDDSEGGDEYMVRVMALVGNDTVGHVNTYTNVDYNEEDALGLYNKYSTVCCYFIALCILITLGMFLIGRFRRRKK